MIRLAVVILNWNGIDFLRRFLPSVINYTPAVDTEIWVADNGSTDGSAEFLREQFSSVRLLELDRNYGFAGGYNIALDEINAKFYILLNSDMEVTPGWTQPLLRTMESDTSIAACMPKIRDVNRREYFEHAGASGGFIDFLGYPFCRGRVFDAIEKDENQYNDEREVFWATGACMMVRGGDWHAEGGFDETFFAHMEEIDLCWRWKNRGKKIMVSPLSVVYHLGGGTLPKENPKKTFLNFRNSLLMLLKNLPSGKLFLLLVRLFLDWLSLLKFLSSFSLSNARAVLRAHWSFFGLIPAYIKKRGAIGNSPGTPGIRRPVKALASLEHREIYKGSVVISFFVLKKRYFSRIY